MTKIVLIDSILDFNVISQVLLQNKDAKFFSFTLEVHKRLESDKIIHQIADNLLTQEERLQLSDKGVEFLSWYSHISSNDLKFEGVNLLKIFDTHEFNSYLKPIIVKFLTVKRIIEKEKPTKIICSNLLSNIVQSVIDKSNIETEFFHDNIEQKLLWDIITIKYNLGPIHVSFNLSKNNYLKIKKFVESVLGFFYGFWLDYNSSKKKSIIILEFNSEYFSTFLHAMKNYDGNVILVNRRRSAVWSKKAIDTIKKSGCKVLNFDNVLKEKEKYNINSLTVEYLKKLENFWENSFFNSFFQIENCSFWNVIKEIIMKKYSEKLPEFILLILNAKYIFENFDVRCIVSLNEVGETEKAFLEFNNKQVSPILLEHGFVERIARTKRYDVVGGYKYFNDKIAVWGNMKKEYLIKEYNIDPNRIIVTGSPRHDDYFNSRIEKKQKEIIVLLAPHPISDISDYSITDLKQKFEKTIKEIIAILKKFDNVKIIVKLHQIQLKHNLEIYSLIKKIDKSIPVYSAVSVIKTINLSDAVIVITTENNGMSTILLESMILGKPTMNIILDDEIPEYRYVKDKAVLTISCNSNFEKHFKNILFDADFRKELIHNADTFVDEFMSYRGNASDKFASILKSF